MKSSSCNDNTCFGERHHVRHYYYINEEMPIAAKVFCTYAFQVKSFGEQKYYYSWCNIVYG